MASGGFSVFVNIGAKLLPSLNSVASSVESRFAKMGRSLRVQAAETSVAFKEMQAALKPVMALAAAGGLAAGFKGILGEGAEYKHQIVMMQNMGRTSKEMADAIAAAHKTMRDVPTSSMNDSLKILNETTLAFGGIEHAIENLSFNSKMGALMKGIMGEGYDEAGGFNQLVRALELRGGKLSSADYQRQANALFRAISVSGGTVNPENILGFMQQAGPAARGYSEQFLTHVIPSLVQEFGGERAGTMATALYNQFNGRVQQGGKSITEEWVRLGLVPKNGTMGNLSKTGWAPGSLKGYSLAMSDPLQYIEQVMMPAMRAKGMDTNNANQMRLEVQKLFGRETAKRLADTLFNPAQLKRINADMALYDKASGVDKAYSNALYNDPRMAGMAAANSLKNLETAMGNSVWNNPSVVKAIVSIAEAINSLAMIMDKHPVVAQISTLAVGFGAVAATAAVMGVGIRMLLAPFIGMTGSIGALVMRLLPLRIAMVGARYGFMAALGVAGPFALAVTGIGIALALIIAKWNGVKAFLSGFADGFMKAMSPTTKANIAMMAEGLGWLGEKLGGLVSWIGQLFGPATGLPAWKSWGESVGAVVGFVADKIALLAGGLMSVWNALHLSAPAPATAPAPNISGKRAMGGDVFGGHTYLVGERGPELFTASRSGVIVPHSELQRRRAAGGGVSVGNVNIYGANDPESTRRILRQELHRMAMGNAALLSD